MRMEPLLFKIYSSNKMINNKTLQAQLLGLRKDTNAIMMMKVIISLTLMTTTTQINYLNVNLLIGSNKAKLESQKTKVLVDLAGHIPLQLLLKRSMLRNTTSIKGQKFHHFLNNNQQIVTSYQIQAASVEEDNLHLITLSMKA